MDAPWGRPWGEEIGRQPFYVWEGFKSIPGTLSHIATIDLFGLQNKIHNNYIIFESWQVSYKIINKQSLWNKLYVMNLNNDLFDKSFLLLSRNKRTFLLNRWHYGDLNLYFVYKHSGPLKVSPMIWWPTFSFPIESLVILFTHSCKQILCLMFTYYLNVGFSCFLWTPKGLCRSVVVNTGQ